MTEPTTQPSKAADAPLSRRRFQFSLRSIFLWTAVVAIVFMIGPPLLYWFVDTFLESRRGIPHRAVCGSNLRNTVMALKGYENQQGAMPPTYTTGSSGLRLHSWRTLILPQLEEQNLFGRVALQQPWNAPANLSSGLHNIPIYRCFKQTGAKNLTRYVAVTGPGTLWPDPAKPGIAHPALPPEEVVVLVELNGLNLPWMEPRDIDIASLIQAAQATPPSPMFDCHPDAFTPRVNVAFADTHVDCLTAKDLAAALQKMQHSAANAPSGPGNPMAPDSP